MPSRLFTWLALPVCWLASCTVAPDGTPIGRTGRITIVHGDFPVLSEGISSADVRAQLGEPAEITPAPSVAGHSEVWVYHLEKYLGQTQVVTHLAERGSGGPLGGEPLAGISEPVYTLVDEKIVVTLHLLFRNGQLVYQVARSRQVIGS